MNSQKISIGSALRAAVGAVAVALLTAVLVQPAQAADTDKPAWYQVVSVKFKPGKTGDALKIIHEHFHKVDKTIGRRVFPFDYQTGDWDHVVYFPFDPSRMDTIPPGADWWKAFAQQEGGVEQARALFQSYLEMVATSKAELAQLPAAWVP
ncbi:MAG TPA: hypothetical protein VMH32_04335 [Burkholderiales bacterium]|nr:hypothetical protein [Burkholderiales bacterium]